MNQRSDAFSLLASEVVEGLRASPKRLASHWFYDDAGSALFEQIMALPEYYLTRAEQGLLSSRGAELVRALTQGAAAGEGVQLIELGSGNGEKTLLLCRALQAAGLRWAYAPIDLSAAALAQLQQRFAVSLPGARVDALLGDFRVHWPAHEPGLRQVALFMGSNLGNLDGAESLQLLGQLRERLCRGDRLLLGLDLQKDPRRILRAYDDEAGLTARFNLNLLSRLNRELQMDFALDAFAHYASYSPLDGVARSFLVSLRAQRVHSRLLGEDFDFAAGESLYTEQSQKYTQQGVARLLDSAGFALVDTLLDERQAYAIFVGEAG